MLVCVFVAGRRAGGLAGRLKCLPVVPGPIGPLSPGYGWPRNQSINQSMLLFDEQARNGLRYTIS